MVEEDLPEIIQEFLEQYDIKNVIAFSGGSDVREADVGRILNDSFAELSQYKNIAILTGGTIWGLPGLASKLAKEYDLPTIGVFPTRGEKDTDRYLLSRVVIVPPSYGESAYGDETELFVKLSQGIVMIAGGNGTAIEFFHAMKMNERFVRPTSNRPPIYIAPIHGLGGFSEQSYNLVYKEELGQVLPPQRLTSGKEASKYLVEKLNIS